MRDEELAAMLAIDAQAFIQNKTRGIQDGYKLNQNRVDWRNVLHNNQNRNNMNGYRNNQPPPPIPPQFQEQYNNFQPLTQPPPGYGEMPDVIPGNIPVAAMQKLMDTLPKDSNGNPILPEEYRTQPVQQESSGLNTSGFQIPNYGNSSQKSLESSETSDKIDNVIAELKLLKRAVNSLTNLLKKSGILEQHKPSIKEEKISEDNTES